MVLLLKLSTFTEWSGDSSKGFEMAEDKKVNVVANRIYRLEILRDRATNQILADGYQKEIDALLAPPKKSVAKKAFSKGKGDWK